MNTRRSVLKMLAAAACAPLAAKLCAAQPTNPPVTATNPLETPAPSAPLRSGKPHVLITSRTNRPGVYTGMGITAEEAKRFRRMTSGEKERYLAARNAARD